MSEDHMSQSPDQDEADPADEALFAELRATIGRIDPVPTRVQVAARAALSWRTIDAELAALTHDTLLEGDRPVATVRHGGTPRLLTFEGTTLTVEVEAIEIGQRRRLVGQLVPPQAAEVEIAHRGGDERVDADEMGRFAADDLLPGPVRVRCLTPRTGGRTFQTPWIVV